MRYYVSKTHDRLNGLPYNPEKYTRYICVNPYYKTTIKNPYSLCIIDSGAFQDVGSRKRLTYEDALKRQLDFEPVIDGRCEALVSYDSLVDEQVNDKGQFKQRVSESKGWECVHNSIEAAKFLVSKRSFLEPRKLILSCQGTTVSQYLECLKEILKIAKPDDIIGFGGFCIISRNKQYERDFYEIIRIAFPLIKQHKIDRVHIFGVGMFRVLIQCDMWARLNGLDCSYDTSSCEYNSVMGKVFDPLNYTLTSVFTKKHKKNGYIPAELAEFNLQSILQFWERFEKTPLPLTFELGMIE